MRLSVALLLIPAFSVPSLSLVQRRTITYFAVRNRSLASTWKSEQYATLGATHTKGVNIWADGKSHRYGPAITLGKLKINLFGSFFGLWEIVWGVLLWYPVTTLYRFFRIISSKLPGDLMKRLDPYRRIPICVGYIWALLSFSPFFLMPKLDGEENLDVLREQNENGKRGKLKPAMYVANHSSWMDIPFVARVLRFRNYKMIAKAELVKVPILGPSILAGGHVLVDRNNRRSQVAAYKSGVQLLKEGVNLVTFPEGTRSKNSRMGSFKKGAFKMAQTAGVPVVPISIHYADKVQPVDYAFPAKSSRSHPMTKVIIGKPIETVGKSEDDLLEEVWCAIADELPESQKPPESTPPCSS